MRNHILIAFLGLTLVAAGCNGGAGNTKSPTVLVPRQPPVPQVSEMPNTYQACSENSGTTAPAEFAAMPGGLWYGILKNDTKKEQKWIDMTVTEDGRFRMFAHYDAFIGTLGTDGNVFSGSGMAFSGGSLWSDGGFKSELTIGGTIAERDSMVGTWSLASGDAGCFEMFYDPELYERPVTLEQLSGEWSTFDGWGLFRLTLTADIDGRFTFYDPWDCSHSGTGQIVLIDDRYNLFEISEMTSDCPDGNMPFSGIIHVISSPSAGNDGAATAIIFVLGNDNQNLRLGLYR